jgi:hypothetical protein
MTQPRARDPWLAGLLVWLVLCASFGLSAATWVDLGVLAGFTGSVTVPVVRATMHLAWLMPIAIDGYVVVSLVTWMSDVPAGVAAFARKNTYAAAAVGVLAQSSYHALTIWTDTSVLWRVVLAAVVGALPPAVAGLSVHMRALIRRESGRTVAKPMTDAGPDNPPVAPAPVVAVTPEPVSPQVIATGEVLPAAHDADADKPVRPVYTDEQIVRDLRNERVRPVKVSRRWVMDRYGCGAPRADRLMAAAGVVNDDAGRSALDESTDGHRAINGHDVAYELA